MNVSSIVRKVRKTLSDNSPAILTGAGVAGCITTGVLAGRAGYKAGYRMSVLDGSEVPQKNRERTKKVARETWKLYLPSAVTGVGTIASIAAANRIGTNRTAAMAATYTIVDRAFSEYQSKVVETIGEKKEAAIHDAVMQDRVNNSVDRAGLIIVGEGKIRCYDAYTDRYFESTMESIKKAMNDINYEIIHNTYVSLSEFYDKLGLPKTAFSDEVGWSSDELLDINFTSVITPDQQTALAFDFRTIPKRKFYSAHL